jgi:hypothetical protein
LYLEILLDWAEGARPFFIRRSESHTCLAALIDCFLTPAPGHIRNRLRAFRMGNGQQPEEIDAFTLDPALLPGGCRIAFSFQDNLEKGSATASDFSSLFLTSDRTPLFEKRRPRLWKPLQLPSVYEATDPFQILNDPGKEITLMEIFPESRPDFLVTAHDSEIQLIELAHWGDPESVTHHFPGRSFHSITAMKMAGNSKALHVIDQGQIYLLNMEEKRLEQTAPGFIPQDLAQNRILDLCERDRANRLFLDIKRNLWLSSAAGLKPLFFHDRSGRPIITGSLIWLRDGSVLFTDQARQTLWHSRLDNSRPGLIFKAVSGSIFFTVDKSGLLYLLEGDEGRLHVLLPRDHVECHVCGSHRAQSPGLSACPSCGALIRKKSDQSPPFTRWFSFELNHLNPPLGPMIVDEDLNLYVVSQGRHISVIPFNPRDMWGRDEV